MLFWLGRQMNDRDDARARAFAVKWSTKSKGEIANLAGCYLSAAKSRREIEVDLLDAIMRACGQLMPDSCIDVRGQLYGISSAKEVVATMLKQRLATPTQAEDGAERGRR